MHFILCFNVHYSMVNCNRLQGFAMPIDADIQQVLESIADQPLTKAANGTLEELRSKSSSSTT